METKEIKGDLILEADFKFDGNLIVYGDIKGKDGLRYDINCHDINCHDIDCHDIDCNDIVCETIKSKKRIFARSLLKNRSMAERKDWNKQEIKGELK